MSISTKKNNKVIIIGGGAAGMMAAVFAAKNGADVTLLEKNEKLGKKIYITGKGRCNLTNDCSLDEFLQSVPRNPRFLYAALSHLNSQETIALVEEFGCPVKVERGQRAFPVSDKASDVTRALKYGMDRLHVKTVLNAEVKAILAQNETVCGVELSDGNVMYCDAVIVATGGLSYPSTGSTGDGYRFANELGISVTSCCPSLTGFNVKDEWTKALQGISLKNIAVYATRKKKTIYHETGEMLFTHFGVSGPLMIELCSLICDQDLNGYEVYIDLKPGMSKEQLDARLRREFSENGNKRLSQIMNHFLPQRFAAIFPQICGVDGEKSVSQISQAERTQLAESLKKLPIHLISTRSYSEAIVTRGGISVKEINASTMETKKIAGLYFAGEVLDVDAFTGGFNLQIAFSTGALAGKYAALQEN